MLHHLRYKSLFLMVLVVNLVSCKDTSVPIKKDNERLKAEVLILNKTVDSLQTQLKKCDDWVNFLEEQ